MIFKNQADYRIRKKVSSGLRSVLAFVCLLCVFVRSSAAGLTEEYPGTETVIVPAEISGERAVSSEADPTENSIAVSDPAEGSAAEDDTLAGTEPDSSEVSSSDGSSADDPSSASEPEPTEPGYAEYSPFSFESRELPLTLGVVEADELNLRSGPGVENDIVCILQTNAVVLVTGETVSGSQDTLWYPVELADGTSGYLRDIYLRTRTVAEGEDCYAVYLRLLGFPESYIPYLEKLHAQYPSWVFLPHDTGLSWSYVLSEEANPPHYMGLNLIHGSSISSWKSTKKNAYDWYSSEWITGWDSGSWVIASDELVAYYLDPRNFLDETYAFMFLDQKYSAQSMEGLQQLVKGTFLEGSFTDVDGKTYRYTDVIYEAGRESGVSPYYLAAMMIQEMGTKGASDSISGTNSKFPGYFNYYNISANKTAEYTAIEHGLWYAAGSGTGAVSYGRPWNSRVKAIMGGAQTFGKNYISKCQNSLYYKKFNVIKSSYYSLFRHQYMSNVKAAYSEANAMSQAYTESMRQSVLLFDIPIYSSMPSSPCPCPTRDGSPNNKLKEIGVDILAGTAENVQLLPMFDIDTTLYSLSLPNSVSSVRLNAAPLDASASVEGTGEYELPEGILELTLKVTAKNGDVREYYVSIYREPGQGSDPVGPTEPGATEPSSEPGSSEPSSEPGSSEPASEPGSSEPAAGPDTPTETPVTMHPALPVSGGHITGIAPGVSLQAVVNALGISDNAVIVLSDASGSAKAGDKAAGTGDVIRITDLQGREFAVLTVLIYGDVNGDGKINLSDMIKVRNHNLETALLQNIFCIAGDVNRDGKVNLSDMIKIRNHNLDVAAIPQ